MNRYPVNGRLLGAGVSDPRSFISMSVTARSTSTASIYAFRYMTATITPRASLVGRLDGIFQLAGSTVASASGLISTITYYAKYLSSSITAKVSSSIGMNVDRFLSSTARMGASSVSELSRGRTLAGTSSASSTSTASISEVAMPAPEARQMILPAENRTMKVT